MFRFKLHDLCSALVPALLAIPMSLLAAAPMARLKAAERLSLWSGQAPVGQGRSETGNAYITVRQASMPNGAALVICPGGGYVRLMVGPEGHGIAQWLNRHGIAGVVLEYRLPKGRPFVPLFDAQRAIRTVRFNAKQWGIDPSRIGIIGFSAGGHLAATAGTHFDGGDPKAADPIDRVSCRPDFAILIYPVITMDQQTHGGSRTNLLGQDPKPEMVTLFSNEKQVTDKTPPMFLAHAKDDKLVSPDNSRMMYEALKAHHVAAEYLELPSGGHGLNGYKGPMWDAWQSKSLAWMAEQKIVRAGSLAELPPLRPVKTEYRSFANERFQRFAWVGQRVAFLTIREDLDAIVMGKLCRTFDKVYEFYRESTGREPSKAKQYEGRVTVAEVQKTCGAGCGNMGATGIELMPYCFKELYDGVAKHDEYDQALPYEFGRNFWFYSPQLAYKNGADAGSVITGYAVFMRFPALETACVKLGSFRGRSGDQFRREVEGLVDRYVADRSLTWENTLKLGKAPQNPMGLGGTDLFASFCFRLCRDNGGQKFVARLWKEVAKRPEAKSTQDAIDNFVLAASTAAGKDLGPLFAETWRWPVSESARRETSQKIARASGPSSDDQYKKLTPDSEEQPGVPKGKLEKFTWDRSKVFPGTTREVTVYVPAQYDAAKPAAVFVCQDGVLYKAPTVFDNLIARKEMPVTIGIFIQPGDFPLKPGEKPRKRPDGRPAPHANRSKEYDTLSDDYARFLLEEILPEVGKKHNLTKDPEGRCIAGSSSGGICAFTVCWQRPDEFHKCFTTVGSFTNIRGGGKYPELVRSAPKKPIRIFQQDGANDIVNQFGSWPEANKAMAKALDEKGYDHKFVFGEGVHSHNHGTQIFPDVMRWMWRDYPK